MKLNKKILAIVAAAAMATSSVSALAASVPVPQSNNQAFEYAESFYFDGLYYEAMQELDLVDPGQPYYDGNKVAAWKGKVAKAISKMEIAKLLNCVKAYHDAGLYFEAQAVIDELNARTDTTMTDFYSIAYWEGVVADKIAKLTNTAPIVVNTEKSAINRVKSTGFELSSDYEWYSPVKVKGGYHVYVKTQLPGGGTADVAAFRVATNGTVERAF